MLDIAKRLYTALANPKVKSVRGNTGMYPASASIELNGKIHGACHRSEFYRWFKYEPTSEQDPENFLITASGNAIHEYLHDTLIKMTVDTDILVLSNEQSFFDSTRMISGRTDLFLKDLKTGLLHGCDIKTVGEYKTSLVITQPSIEHMLQCAVYLDQYNKAAALNNSKPVEDWIILYFSRTESWRLKRYPHGSMFKYLWQYSLDLKKGFVCITDQLGVVKEYPEITMEKINQRYKDLLDQIRTQKLPERDFEFQYSEEKILGLYKQELLNKTNSAVVKKWLDKGAKEGELGLEMGDYACKSCNHTTLCWSNDPLNRKKSQPILYSIPKELIMPIAPILEEKKDLI